MGVPKLENKSDFIQLLLEYYNNVQFQEILSKFLNDIDRIISW